MAESDRDLVDELDMEDYLHFAGVDFRVTTGKAAAQLNLRECPRCGGTDWKVFINAETGFGNCFHGSCVGEPGYNKLTFIKALISGEYKEAFEEVRRYGREIGWQPARVRRKIEVQLDPTVNMPKSTALPCNSASKYLQNRGITAETQVALNWRYSKDGVYNYTDHEGKPRQQFYNDRVILPIFNLDGKLVTFQGRDMTGTHLKKYLFPPGLPGTGRYFYNGHAALNKNIVVMNEGVFDVAACKQALDEDKSLQEVGVMGSFGKSLSGDVMINVPGQVDQITQLLTMKSKGLKELVFMWDGERKAIVSAIDASSKVKALGIKVTLAILPKDKDPAECTSAEVRMAFYKRVQLTNLAAMKLKLIYQRS